MRARLIESRTIGPEIKHFVFEVTDVERFDYTPGQFVSFSETVAGRTITRAYSLASAPAGNRFDLCLNRVREGIFSPFLFDLSPGAEVEMRPALGYFVPREPFRDAVFVATGTGIAPFRGFLQCRRVNESTASVTLLFGARYEESLVYREEFDRLTERRPGFVFMPTLTRPGSYWTGRAGRVQQHLDEALGGRTDLDVYICGLKEMVDDVRQMLKSRGFDRKRILYEKYD
jgi:CDP-4-dehydro-6-deoxyglucose reductase